jgi:RsiW-degrading membrane proteinase PrsW (M82 family)
MATDVAMSRGAVTRRAEAPERRVFWQPRRWTFWAYVGLVVVSTAPWYGAFSSAGVLSWWLISIAVVLTLVLGLLLVMLIRWLDVYRGTHAALLVGAFVWGGVVATAWAVVANDNLMPLTSKLFGATAGERWSAAFSAPLVEETLKTVGIAVVILIGREFVRRPVHGMVIGAFCGLGFQLVEDMLYAVQNAISGEDSDASGMLPVIFTRSITALDSHWLYSAMAGLGIGYAMTDRARPRAQRLLLAVGLFAVAWWMHFLSDSPLVSDQLPDSAGLVASFIKGALNLVLGFVVYRAIMGTEWRHYAAAVRAEPSEVITPAEIESMRTNRHRRRARKRQSMHGGTPAKRMARSLQRSQLQLANDVETDPDAAARTRTRIRHLRSELAEATAG